QRALEKATGEWVLSLDADERVTPELAREINDHLADPDADAYKLPWAVTIYGSRLDFGRSGRAPLRLFRREGVSFSDAL
ncbi:glycosyltransferase, partial [Pantoea sp. SIMBA_133]